MKTYYKILLISLIISIFVSTVVFIIYNQMGREVKNYGGIYSEMIGADVVRDTKSNTKKDIEKLKYLLNVSYLFKKAANLKNEALKFHGKFVIYPAYSEGSLEDKYERENIKVIMHDLIMNRFYNLKIGTDYTFSEYIPSGTYLITMNSKRFGVGGIIINLMNDSFKDLPIRLFSEEKEIMAFHQKCQDIENEFEYSNKYEKKCGFEEEDFTCSVKGSVEGTEYNYKNISVVAIPELRNCENSKEVFKGSRAMIWGDILNEKGEFFLNNMWCKEAEVYLYDRIKMDFCKKVHINFFKNYELKKIYAKYTQTN